MPAVDAYPNIVVLCSIHYKRLSSVNVESSVFIKKFYLVLLVIYVLCKLCNRKKNWVLVFVGPWLSAPNLKITKLNKVLLKLL